MSPASHPEHGNGPDSGRAGGGDGIGSSSGSGPPPSLADSLALKRTRLALVRTGLAQERTLMGWVRTCFSIIGFGFTIFSFVLGRNVSAGKPAQGQVDVEVMCLALTLGGTVFMALAVAHHRVEMRKLVAEGLEPGFSVATLTSVLVCGAGLLGSWAILVG